MPGKNKVQWAGKVSRRDIQRLYDSDAQDLLDEGLLDKVMYSINARIRDMFEVMEAQKFGRVKCRNCFTTTPVIIFRTHAYLVGNLCKNL
jgi:predicted TPR repeat methyltransferase